MRSWRRTLRDLAAAAALLLSAAGAAAGGTAKMTNASHATSCAEEDNIDVRFSGAIAGLRLRAQHPAYMDEVGSDSTDPDFSRCDMSHDPSFPFTPRDVTLFDDGAYRLLGHAYKTNWRPHPAPVRVGERVEADLHLLQLFKKIDGAWIEFLVVYPADGYWRAKPLPPPRFADTAYGSSFLIGPIEVDGRPLVALSEIEFLRESLSFRLRFRRGGSARLTVAALDRDGLDLDVAFTDVPGGGDLAALRSMFVTPAQADVGEASWQGPGGAETHGILDFTSAEVSQVRFGRATKSQHNLSAPDMVFGPFR